MSDLQEQTADDGESTDHVDAASEEIARSLGSVWQRFSGQRPKSTSVEMSRGVVTCVIEEGTPEPGADKEDEAPGDPTLSQAGLKQNATAVITRITGRRVVAFIPKRDNKTEICTHTFLLDTPRKRF